MYQDQWSRPAARFYQNLSGVQQQKIDEAVDRICNDPVSAAGVKALKGTLKGKRRVRIGQLRLIYSFDSASKILNVLTLDNRKDVYR
jgi:mRNA interferase RelE/StbE